MWRYSKARAIIDGDFERIIRVGDIVFETLEGIRSNILARFPQRDPEEGDRQRGEEQ